MDHIWKISKRKQENVFHLNFPTRRVINQKVFIDLHKYVLLLLEGG